MLLEKIQIMQHVLFLCMFKKICKNITKSVKLNRQASITYKNHPLAFLES